MAPKGKPDLTCTHPAVKLVRDAFRLCPNRGFRLEMIACGNTDMRLWRQTINDWKRPFTDSKGKLHKKGHNPLDYKGMMAEFDRRYFNSKHGAKG